jgi:hypothetical protein
MVLALQDPTLCGSTVKSTVALAPTISMEREKAMRKQPSAPIPAIILNKYRMFNRFWLKTRLIVN